MCGSTRLVIRAVEMENSSDSCTPIPESPVTYFISDALPSLPCQQRQVIWRDTPPQYVPNVSKLKYYRATIQLAWRRGRGIRSDGPEVCDKTTNDNCPRVEKADEQDDVEPAKLKVKRVPVNALILGACSRVETL